MSDTPTSTDLETAMHASHSQSAVSSLEKNRKTLLICALLAVVAIGAFIVYTQIQEQQRKEAAAAFSAAVSTGEIEKLDQVAVDFPGTVPAGNAILSKAEILLNRNKADDAAKTVETFLSNHPEHSQVGQAHFILASIAQKSGELTEAAERYQLVLEQDATEAYHPLSLIRLGDLAAAGGDPQKAKENYNQSIQQYPGNQFISLAENRMRLLDIDTPPVVEKPTPPPAPAEEKSPAPTAGEKKAAPKPQAKADPKPAAKPRVDPKPAAKPKPQPEKNPAPQPKPTPKPKPAE